MSARVSGYVLHERLGEGASATVHRAEPEGAPGRVVAVKRLHRRPSADAVAALRREADALDRLSHPAILRLLDVVDDEHGVALVLAYAPGGTLAERIAAADATVTSVVVADLGARLASALAAAHGAGLVHGDVKPANVLLDLEGQPLLADLGTARLADPPPIVAGTAEYLDPAVAAGDPPGPASDVYGLGATLYEALAGVPPHAGSSPQATLRAADRGRLAPLAELVDAPATLTAAVEQALARDPAARPVPATVLAGRLDEARRVLEERDGPAALSGLPRPAGAARREPRGSSATPADTDAPDEEVPGGGRRVAATAAPVERSATRRFGPAPPALPTRGGDGAASRRRWWLLAAAVAVLAVPVGVTAWLLAAPAGDPGLAADADEATHTDDATGVGDAGVDDAAERTPPPRCDDVTSPAATDAARVVDGDIEGRGCSVPVVWDGATLVVPRADGAARRYELDAREDDLLVLGDWTCDGRDSPALYRPETGAVYRFDGFAEGGEPVTGRPTSTGVERGTPRVVTDADDCDRVIVEP